MAEVHLSDLCKTYPGEVQAVVDATFTIEPQEFVVLVGPSGCGKTTTLRMIAGLEDITSGELSIDGKLMNEVPPKDRDIAMVFQSYALYPHMTVYDNMAFGLKIRKIPKEEIRDKVISASKILDIVELLSRKPQALSGGQRQRIALARALVRRPNLLILDEPTTALDPKTEAAICRTLRDLGKRVTILAISHQPALKEIADFTYRMAEGRVVAATPAKNPTSTVLAGN